jgi:zinc protease
MSFVCAAALFAAPCGAQAAANVRPLEYTRFVLPNGLVALLNEDHTSPIVAVDVWYHIGAKDELPGHTGLAHLCEHLMGEGSPNLPSLQRAFIQSVGGTSTFWANTTEDITHFYYTLPSNQLEPALWLESDRMAAPLSRADDAHLGPVREVIRQERLQNRENPVFGLADAATVSALFPGTHPYRTVPLGPMADVDRATASEAKQFCAPYYVPSNAVVSLSGDLDPAHARTLIERYFGGIPRGSTPARRDIPSTAIAASTRVVLEDSRARTATLRLAWPSVAFADPDRVPLVALAALLTRERTNRLTKLLVVDRDLATRVTAVDYDFEHGGLFQIDVTAKPGVPLTRIEQLVDSAVAAFDLQPIAEQEFESFKRSNAVSAVTLLQTRALRADTLAHGEMFAHDPVAYAKQLNRMFALTAADVQRVAKRYLSAPHVVMSMIPAGKLDLISRPDLPYTNVTQPLPRSTP